MSATRSVSTGEWWALGCVEVSPRACWAVLRSAPYGPTWSASATAETRRCACSRSRSSVFSEMCQLPYSVLFVACASDSERLRRPRSRHRSRRQRIEQRLHERRASSCLPGTRGRACAHRCPSAPRRRAACTHPRRPIPRSLRQTCRCLFASSTFVLAAFGSALTSSIRPSSRSCSTAVMPRSAR